MMNKHKLTDFLESSKKEAFLQSESWRKFQEEVGRKTFHVEDVSKPKGGAGKFCAWANIIVHDLPMVGEYFYIPRGPIFIGDKNFNLFRINDAKKTLDYIFWLAKDNDAGWIRFDSRSEKDLVLIGEAVEKVNAKEKKNIKIQKAPHDVQPKEIFVIDISKDQETLLSEMKSKTRYNIRLSEKRGVIAKRLKTQEEKKEGLEEFLKLNSETAARDGIVTHPDEYYRKMVMSLPDEMLQIYLAEYEGKIIAANIMITFGDTTTYAHGASSSENRDVMAPYLLQWQAILDAKKAGCKYYDFGGVSTNYSSQLAVSGEASKTSVDIRIANNKWEGITRFKTGFSSKTHPIVFPGSYDIIINPQAYAFYRGLQKVKAMFHGIRKQFLNF